jgi:hypothetical protein
MHNIFLMKVLYFPSKNYLTKCVAYWEEDAVKNIFLNVLLLELMMIYKKLKIWHTIL